MLYGGSEADVFKYVAATDSGSAAHTRDRIADFNPGLDEIDLSSIDASSVVSGNNAFVWRGTGTFTTRAGEVRYQQFDNAGAKDFTIVYVDTDSDKASEFQVELSGLRSLSAADFVL